MKMSYILNILLFIAIMLIACCYVDDLEKTKRGAFDEGFRVGLNYGKHESPKYINLPEEVSISDNNQKMIAIVHNDTLFVEYPTGSIFQRTGDTIIIKY